MSFSLTIIISIAAALIVLVLIHLAFHHFIIFKMHESAILSCLSNSPLSQQQIATQVNLSNKQVMKVCLHSNKIEAANDENYWRLKT